MHITAIVFDFFGIFIEDTFALYSERALSDKEAHRIRTAVMSKVDRDEINETEFFTILSAASGSEVAAVKDTWASLQTLNPEAVALVQSLQQYRIGLCSNAASWELRPLLDRYALEPLFDAVTISGEVGIAKPDTRIFAQALDALGVTAAETLFIDDSQTNIDAATALGISAIRYTDIATVREELRERGVRVKY